MFHIQYNIAMEFKKSTRAGKKYMVVVNGKTIHFGSSSMEHYRDTTPLKLYTHLNHNDKKRRASYLARAKGIRNKAGELTYKDKNSANYFSIKFLWSG